MRKSLIALLLLAALSAGGFAAAHAALLSQREDVTLTQEVLYGDAAAADGLELTIPVNYNDMQFWTTTYTPGSSPTAVTEYEIEQLSKRIYHGTVTYDGVRVTARSLPGFGSRFRPNEPEQPGIFAAYQEIYDQNKVGQELRKFIYVADYCDYYPLQLFFEFPAYYESWDFYEYDEPDEYLAPVVRAFEEFFRIPVLPQESVVLTLERYERGGASCGDEGNHGNYFLDTKSVMTEDACYLTFDTYTYNDHMVDTSLIPGGYGIYRLPLDREHIKYNDLSGIRADELEMVYAMDPAFHLYDLTLSDDGRQLLLHTREDENYVLTVIDIATMETVRRFQVPTTEGWFVLYPQDGFFAVQTDPNRLSVFAPDESGEYDLALTTEVYPEGGPKFRPSDNYPLNTAPMAWDGERLAIFAQQYATSLYCELSFLLGVYDADGTAYLGSYRNSLEPPGVEGLRSRLDSSDPPVLRWTK